MEEICINETTKSHNIFVKNWGWSCQEVRVLDKQVCIVTSGELETAPGSC